MSAGYRLNVAGGVVVTPNGLVKADVHCVDGCIAAITSPGGAPEADERVDANGLLVFPGFIDPHVHSRDPGMTYKEDFAHSTLGALCGGVTTLLEMPNAIPPVADVEVFRNRAEAHERVASVDFGLWGMSLGMSNVDQLPALFDEGAVAVKLFWGYALSRETQALVYNLADEPPENVVAPPDNGEVLEVFRAVAACGGLLAAHCEDRGVIEAAERRLGRDVETYEEFLEARPDTAEAASVALAIEFARASGCSFHVVHMGSGRAAQLVRDAQRQNIPITAETCPQYLTLTKASYDEVGPVMKVYPPIREARDRDALLAAVADGTIVSIGSDHGPHSVDEKMREFATRPAGMVGVETLVSVMLNEMTSGRMGPERLAAVLSESTARLFGVYPQKGAILPGSDADFTLVDPHATQTIRNEELHAKHPLSAWDGTELTGVPVASILRGEVLMSAGQPVGEPRGRLVRARHGPVDSGTDGRLRLPGRVSA